VGDKQIAQDTVQDTFVKFWSKRNDIDSNVNIKAYLFTAVRNKALELLRRDKMKESHADKIAHLESLRNDDNAEAEAEKYVRLERIHAAIKTLPPKCQEVFSLSKINGLSYQEIADYKGISVKTVENQVVRALKLLREKLSK